MPNFKLSPNMIGELAGEANRLLGLMVNAAESDFPLTPARVIQAVIPKAAWDHLDALEAMKAHLNTTRCFYAIMHHEEHMPRAILLELNMPEDSPYLWDTQTRSYSATDIFRHRVIKTKEASRLPFNFEVLDEDEQAKLLKWAGEASRQRRICTNAHALVKHFLQTYCNSTAELLARWPGLKILFTRMSDPWPMRIRDKPRRSLRYWGWSEDGPAAVEWWLANEKKMAAVEGLLAAASMMDTGKRGVRGMRDIKPGEVVAHVLAWDKPSILPQV